MSQLVSQTSNIHDFHVAFVILYSIFFSFKDNELKIMANTKNNTRILMWEEQRHDWIFLTLKMY